MKNSQSKGNWGNTGAKGYDLHENLRGYKPNTLTTSEEVLTMNVDAIFPKMKTTEPMIVYRRVDEKQFEEGLNATNNKEFVDIDNYLTFRETNNTLKKQV
ncbi:ADP-ribosyltransferase [Bacillus cereus]|nr:ADP-ribosyltransferase [Bacillus cereus]